MVNTRNAKTKERTLVPINTVIVGLDVGFNSTSIISSAKQGQIHTFPSGVVEASTRLKQGDIIDESNLSIDRLRVIVDESIETSTKVNGKRKSYFVGENALSSFSQDTIREFKKDRGNDKTSQILFHTALGYACPDVSGDYEVHLFTGLPNENTETQIEDDLRKFLEKPFTITFMNEDGDLIEKHITVVDCQIGAQPDGTLTKWRYKYNLGSASNGFLVELIRGNQRNLGVIDIGHFTTDYCQYLNGEYVEGIVSGSYPAVEELYKAISNIISNELSTPSMDHNVRDISLDECVRNGGFYNYNNIQYAFTEELKKAKTMLAKRIIKKVISSWNSSILEMDAVIFTGGGAQLLKEELEEQLKEYDVNRAVVIDQPSTANVWGYYILASIIYFEDTLNSNVNVANEFLDTQIPQFMLDGAI